jgi:selenium metabolism protein YedF
VDKVVVITSDRMGSDNEGLGRLLMKNFLYSLARNTDRPSLVFFANDGVRLTCDGSESIDDLRLLVEDGVAVQSCGTCLDFLHLKQSLAVGALGKMHDLVSAMLAHHAEVVTIG